MLAWISPSILFHREARRRPNISVEPRLMVLPSRGVISRLAENEDSQTETAEPLPMSDAEKARLEKLKEIERLRAAEKYVDVLIGWFEAVALRDNRGRFIEIDTDEWACRSCGYTYDPKKVRVRPR